MATRWLHGQRDGTAMDALHIHRVDQQDGALSDFSDAGKVIVGAPYADDDRPGAMALAVRFENAPITVQTAGARGVLIAQRDGLCCAVCYRRRQHKLLELFGRETAQHDAGQPLAEALDDCCEQVNTRNLAVRQQCDAVDANVGTTQEI